MLLSHLEFTAPDTITAVADAVEWVLRLRGVCDVEHYLDDWRFITVGPECKENLDIVCGTCRELNLPLVQEKRVGPVILLDFGGIELNTVRMEIRLPPVKLMHTKELRTA